MKRTVRVRVLPFGALRDRLGREELTLAFDRRPALREVLARAGSEARGGRIPTRGMAVAVNGVLVRGDVELEAGDEVALLPPVSGG